MSGDLFKLPCVQCEQPMTWRGTRVGWVGDNEFTTMTFECPHACQTHATVDYQTFIPQDIAAGRQP